VSQEPCDSSIQRQELFACPATSNLLHTPSVFLLPRFLITGILNGDTLVGKKMMVPMDWIEFA
jgi:hypothetical protein